MTISLVVAHEIWMVRCFPCTPEIWPKEYVRQFDQNFAVSVIYCFYLHTPIREKHIVLFHLIFLLYMNIQPKFRFLINFFFIHTRPFHRNIGSFFIYSFFCARHFTVVHPIVFTEHLVGACVVVSLFFLIMR